MTGRESWVKVRRRRAKPKRKHIPLITRLAAALASLHPELREDAKLMTARQFVSLFHFDHAELHALTGNDHFTNLTPMLIKPHRRKSVGDRAVIRKVYRNEDKWREFTRKMLPKPRKR